VGVEDGLEAAPVGAPGDSVEPPAETGDPTRLDDDQDEEDDDRDPERDDGNADGWFDGGVQVDRTVLRNGGEESLGGRPSLAFGTSPLIA